LVNQINSIEYFIYILGTYFVLTGKFEFKRLMGFAVLQIYVPSIAIVAVSWISLWIRRNATPARVGKIKNTRIPLLLLLKLIIIKAYYY